MSFLHYYHNFTSTRLHSSCSMLGHRPRLFDVDYLMSLLLPRGEQSIELIRSPSSAKYDDSETWLCATLWSCCCTLTTLRVNKTSNLCLHETMTFVFIMSNMYDETVLRKLTSPLDTLVNILYIYSYLPWRLVVTQSLIDSNQWNSWCFSISC